MRLYEFDDTRMDVRWKAPNYSDYAPLWVDAEAIMASWSTDRNHFIDGPRHPNAIGKRYDGFGEWLRRGDAVEMSVLSLDHYDRIYFSNGRHRFIWLRNHGAKALPVMVPDEQRNEIARRFGTDERHTIIKTLAERAALMRGSRTIREDAAGAGMSPDLLAAAIDATQSAWASMHNTLLNDTTCAARVKKVYREITRGKSHIQLYRALIAPEDWVPEEETREHRYWSWAHEGAVVYWGDDSDGVEWNLYAKAPLSSIDWPATIAANITRPEEMEVTLRPNVPLDDFEAEIA